MLGHEAADSGTAEMIVSGLIFEIDGLASTAAVVHFDPDNVNLSEHDPQSAAQAMIHIFPGHALSGGLTMGPVSRALLAIAAELALQLPVQSVEWHPAGTIIEAPEFSRSVLGWLAGGVFPAPGLVALMPLADGSVVSRGMAHFIGQELTLRGWSHPQRAKLAAHVVDQLVRSGPLMAFTQWRIQGTPVNAEPAPAAKQVLAWPAE